MANSKDCRSAVAKAVPDAFTDDEIDDVLERLQRAKERAAQADPLGHDEAAWDAAAAEITKSEVTAALMQRRLEVFAKRAQVERRARLDALPGREDQKLRAYDVGSEAQAEFTGASVDAEGRARSVGLWSMVEGALRDDPTLQARLVSKISGRADPEFERMVAREMARLNGADIPATGDAGAVKAAKAFTDALEAGRQMQNQQGAWIGKIAGYIGRQSHDRGKVAGGFWRELAAARAGGVVGAADAAGRKAFREWRDFIKPLLDPKTFDGFEAADAMEGLDAKGRALLAGTIDALDDPREHFLYAAWWNIVTGGNDRLGGASDLGEFRPPAGKARAVSKERVFHFAGPDAWMTYAEAYSQGGLYGAIMGDLDRAGRNAALMARWGPSPEAARAAEIDRLSQLARARGDVKAADGLQSPMRKAEFDELTGASSGAASLRLAQIGRGIRMAETLSKLGGVVLSALSDGSLAAQRMKRAGGSYLDGYSAVLKGVGRMQGEEGRAVADALDVGARSAAAHLTTRFSAADGPLGWGSYATRLFFKINGLQAWMDGARSGLAETLASVWGRQSDRAWSALEAGTREDFTRHGIDEHAWNLLRSGAAEMGDGRRYLTPDAADIADDEAVLAWIGWSGKGEREGAVAEARGELRLRLQTMVQSVLDDALTEPRARERATLTMGLRPGTVGGEAIRLVTQFLSFSNTVIGRHLAPALKGYAGEHPVSLLAHLIVASTALGYLSLQMKQLVKGREIRGLENDDGESRAGSLFVASMLQGGGLGLYGDFLFGEAARTGLPATISTFMGPAVGDAEKLFSIVNKAVWGDEDEKADAGGDAAKFAITSAPGANLFYTRWALDYLVLYRMQEAMSPGYLQRYENRVEDREGAGFLVDPSEAIAGQ